MAFRDLAEFLSAPPFVLPIRGREYAFPGEVSARLWLRLQRLRDQMGGSNVEPDDEVVSDDEELNLRKELFGGVDAEMAADGCTSTQIERVFYTLLAYHLSGRETAERVWEMPGEPAAPSRATQRTAKRTRSRGSRDGSTVQKAKAEPGETSSNTGT